MNLIASKVKLTGEIRRNTMALVDIGNENSENTTNESTVQTEQPFIRQGVSNETSVDDHSAYLRAKLRFFFMSPCWKWHLKRQFPWKAWFQFLKIIIVTTQLILFGFDRQTHVVFISESNITFHHLFVRDWSASDETLPYPRSSGDFALYTSEDLKDSINYVVHRFYNLTDLSLGLFDFHEYTTNKQTNIEPQSNKRVVSLCLNKFKECKIDPASHSYKLNIEVEDVCFKINVTNDFDIDNYFINQHNIKITACGLNYLTIEFSVHAIQLKNQKPFSLPDCYHFLVKVTFDNSARTGKIRQHLNSQSQFRVCNKEIINRKANWVLARRDLLIVFDFIVVFISIISCILCVRSLWFGHRLAKEVRVHYAIERPHEKPLTWSDMQIFYSYWYFLMVVTDLMVIPGSIIKIIILYKGTDNYNAAGVLLGLSSLLSWISILRYLSFFRTYNILFITIQKALPLLLRFLLCAIIIFFGFTFCGWIVLGPYHTKFRTLSSTFDALFSLINGDDMYTTYANLETESIYVWLFSEVYLYAFSCLFIFVISSLIIALVIDGYETVKKYYTDGFPKNRLQLFSEEGLPEWSGTQELHDLTIAIEARSMCFPCCFKTPKELIDVVTKDTNLVRHVSSFK